MRMSAPSMKAAATAAVLGFALIGSAGLAAAQTPELSQSQMRAVGKACKSDVKTLCAGVQPGGGRIGQCLQQNAAKLSAPCRQTLSEVLAK
ncbi:hypothetical protein AB7M35_000994 [Amorphus suaedae]